MLIFFWVNYGGEPPPPDEATLPKFVGLRRNVGLLLR